MDAQGQHQSNTPSIKEVLLQLQSPHADVRTHAEELINKSQIDQLLPALAAAAASAENDVSSRQLAAVLVRQYVHSKLKEGNITEIQKQTILIQILQSIMNALSPQAELIVRKAAAEAIGEVWRQAASPELIAQTAPFGLVSQWLEAQQAEEQGDDVTLLWLLIDRLADIAGPEVYIHRAQQIVQKLNLTLQMQKIESVVAAEEAFATLFARTVKWKPEGSEAQQEKKNATSAYCTLCPSLLRFASMHASPELLAPLVSLAEKSPMFFRDQHPLLLQCVRDILINSKNSDETKKVTLQLAAGAFVRAVKFARKHMDLVEELLMLLADAAASVPFLSEDLASWEEQEREEETPEETTQSVALELMAELSSELCEGNEQAEATAAANNKGGGVMDLLMNILSRLMSQNDYRYSCVALDLLSLLLEDDTCRPLLGRFVGSLTSACLTAVKSEKPKLRWGGLKCLGLLLQHDESYSTELRQQHGQELLFLLSQISSNDISIRCRRQALLALAAFLSGMAPEEGDDPNPEALALIIPHMNGVLSQAVIAGCSSDDSQTQEFALALASALAKACGTAFIPYYPPFMVALRNLLGGEKETEGDTKIQKMLNNHSGRCLLQAAVEFAADLGSAVGSEVFKADAPWLVDRVHRLLLLCDENPSSSSVFSASMICLGVAAPASGPELLKQIQPIMNIVLTKAQASIEFGVEEQLVAAGGSLNEVAELSEEGGFSQIRVQDKTGKQMIMSINTAAVEERVAALRLLGALASAVNSETPAEMTENWISAILTSCSSEFSFVRKTAFEALPNCLNALKSSPQRQGEATTAAIEIVANFLSGTQGQVPPAQATLASESMLPAIAQILSNQSKLQREGLLHEDSKIKQNLRNNIFETFFAGMGKLILPFLTREFERLATKEQDDDEWESLSDEEDDEEESSACYDAVMQCTGGFFKIYGAECVPFFDAHLQMPYGALLAHEHASYYGKVAALCIFADAINFGGESAARNYSNVFLPAALLAVCPPPDSASDEDQLLAVCAAAYGIGAVAQRDPETFAARLQPAIEALERSLSNPAMKSENGRAAADCAACALLKILAAFGPQQDTEAASTMLAKLLENWFPLQEDPQEILDAHELLLQMVVQGHALCRNPLVQQQLRRLLEVFANKPDLLSDKAKREGLLQAAKERLC